MDTSTATHWTDNVIEVARQRLRDHLPPVVVILDRDEATRDAMMASLVATARDTTPGGGENVRKFTLRAAMSVGEEGAIVTATREPAEAVAEAARLAGVLGWLLIASFEGDTVPAELTGFDPIVVQVEAFVEDQAAAVDQLSDAAVIQHLIDYAKKCADEKVSMDEDTVRQLINVVPGFALSARMDLTRADALEEASEIVEDVTDREGNVYRRDAQSRLESTAALYRQDSARKLTVQRNPCS